MLRTLRLLRPWRLRLPRRQTWKPALQLPQEMPQKQQRQLMEKLL